MDMRRDLQNPCLNRYLKGMAQRERNLQRKRRRQLKRIAKETVICITAGALMAGALTYAFLNDTYQPPPSSAKADLLERHELHSAGI